MLPTTAENVTVDDSVSEPLTAHDRCDQCGAQAYIRVSIGDSDLLFCAHHGRRNEEKLRQIATAWHDETDRLLESHSV